MAQPFTGTATISTAEYSLTTSSTTVGTQTTSGIFQLVLGLQNLAAGDVYRLRIREKVTSTTAQIVVDVRLFTGLQATPGAIIASLILVNGWDLTLTKISGTDRSIDWSIRSVAVT